ncbi:MAG: hypothetical protein MI757_17460 [Pirellulales bacterium]|nr:hypothetical protein [Pirellulales bacterium]
MPDWLTLSSVIGIAVATGAGLFMASSRLRGTTLAAVAWWAFASVSAIAIVEAWIAVVGVSSSTTVESLRWFGACSTLCPMMAQFGAKRPQDRGWQWIVLSLWAILSLPAGQALVLGRTFQVSTMWWLFAWTLMAIGALNMMLTRYWLPTMFVALGQLVLFLGNFDDPVVGRTVGLSWFALAALVACLIARRERTGTGLDRTWLDFRDMFGMVWALRVAEQLNKSSEMYDWGVTVRWDGIVDSATGEPAEPDPQTSAAIERSMRTLLRRFVSPAWLDTRLGPSAEQTRHKVSPE